MMWRIFTSNPRIFWVILSLYHFIICFFAYRFIATNGGDANKYWFRRGNAEKIIENIHWPMREHLLYAVNYVMAVQWSLPFWFGFLLYASIGLVAILFLLKIIRQYSPKPQIHPLFFLLLFLPSMHFWTSFIGKEPVVFLGLAMAFYALSKNKIQAVYLCIGLLLVGLIRPQMAAIFIFCLGIAFLFHKKLWSWKYLVFFGLITVLVVLSLTQASWFGSFSWDAIQNYIDVHHRVLAKTSTYVPLEEYSWPYKIFTYYFRPLPGELPGMMGWLQGIENLFLFIISGFGLFAFIQNIRKMNYRLSLMESSILLFFIVSAIVLSLAYSNFGLISRMKNMSMPFMLMLWIHWIIMYLNPTLYAQSKTD